MIPTIEILIDAAIDIKDVSTWYKNISPELASRFISQLYIGFGKIVEQPNASFNITKRVKRYRLHGFPYLIFFAQEGEKIIILGLIHEKRDPKTWRSKIRRK